MIALDTHIWVWWVEGSPRLTSRQLGHILAHQASGLVVSVICCWEVAKLFFANRLALSRTIDDWLVMALHYPGVRLMELTPDIALAANRLPGQFHRDPADQILVATARELKLPLLTADARILAYPHVQTLP